MRDILGNSRKTKFQETTKDPEVEGSRIDQTSVTSLFSSTIERVEKTPTPKISALLRKRPVLLQADFVLTKDRKRPYYRHFCGKIHREGSCSKAAGGP